MATTLENKQEVEEYILGLQTRASNAESYFESENYAAMSESRKEELQKEYKKILRNITKFERLLKIFF